MGVKIVLPQGGNSVGAGTRIFNDSGSEISGISKIKISIEPDEIVQAEFTVDIHAMEQMDNIHALLSTATIEQVALLHGYELVPLPPEEL